MSLVRLFAIRDRGTVPCHTRKSIEKFGINPQRRIWAASCDMIGYNEKQIANPCVTAMCNLLFC